MGVGAGTLSAPGRLTDVIVARSPCPTSSTPNAGMLGFRQFRNAAITIAGIELMHRIRKGQFAIGRLGVHGRVAPAVWNAVLET